MISTHLDCKWIWPLWESTSYSSFCKSRAVLFERQTGCDTVYYYINRVTRTRKNSFPKASHCSNCLVNYLFTRTIESSWTKESVIYHNADSDFLLIPGNEAIYCKVRWGFNTAVWSIFMYYCRLNYQETQHYSKYRIENLL